MIYVIDGLRFRRHRLFRRGAAGLVAQEAAPRDVARALEGGASWVDLVHPNEAPHCRESVRVYFGGGAPYAELPLEQLGEGDVVFVATVTISGNVTWHRVSCRTET